MYCQKWLIGLCVINMGVTLRSTKTRLLKEIFSLLAFQNYFSFSYSWKITMVIG